MNSVDVPWRLTHVFAVYLLRIVLGLLLLQYIFPANWLASTLFVDMTDRVIILSLVYWVFRRFKVTGRDIGFTLQKFWQNVALGIFLGIFLLIFSVYTEKLYSTALSLSVSEHPLVALTRTAGSWRELAAPLFLAGVVSPVTEELFYRTFTFLPLWRRMGFWLGIISSAALFTLMHFNLAWLAEMLAVGVGLAWAYGRSGSLILVMTAHCLINSTKIFMIYWKFPFL